MSYKYKTILLRLQVVQNLLQHFMTYISENYSVDEVNVVWSKFYHQEINKNILDVQLFKICTLGVRLLHVVILHLLQYQWKLNSLVWLFIVIYNKTTFSFPILCSYKKPFSSRKSAWEALIYHPSKCFECYIFILDISEILNLSIFTNSYILHNCFVTIYSPRFS